MADEIELRFTMPGEARANMAAWRDAPPPPVADARLELVDRTLETLVYEGHYTDLGMKMMNFMRFGSLIKLPKTEAIWRLTVRFDADEHYGTRVTATGRLAPRTREALGTWASQQGEVQFAAGVAAG